MKKSVLLAAAFVALIATSCRKIEMDGGGSTVVAPPTTPGVQTIVLKGRIDKDTVLREGNNYILSGIVYMVNNATMTIQPGVTVKGDYTGACEATCPKEISITNIARLNSEYIAASFAD